MEKNTLYYSWKVNVSFDFNKPDSCFTSLSVKFKNKKTKRRSTLQMARPRKATRNSPKSNSNGSQNKKVSPSTKKPPRGNARKRNASTLSLNCSPYNTRIRTKRTAVEECKPVAIYELDDTPVLVQKSVRRNPRPVIDNNVYVVPDSDDDNDIVYPSVSMPEEKRKQIQDYINSITPNRVDYGTKPSMADIFQIKDDELIKSPEATEDEIQRIIRKHAKSMILSPETNVIERVDYKAGGMSIQSRTPIANSVLERCQVELEPVPSTSWANNLENDSSRTPVSTRQEHTSPKDAEVMEYVDEIVAEHRDKISMEVEERYNRIWRQVEEDKQKRMEEAKNNYVDLDSSIEIIETPELLDKDVKLDDPLKEDKKKETKERPEKLCPICLESLSDGKELSATVCGHVYCTPCIKTAIIKHHRCPACRTKLTLKKIIPLFL